MQTDWNSLIKEIDRGNCVIFLGHGLLSDPDGVPMYWQFCDKLAMEHHDLISSYYPEENFFLFKSLKNRRKFTNQIEDFYKSLVPDMELYTMLAEIPVSLYITVSPDNFLDKVLYENGQVAFFNDPENKGMDIEASKENPLIYHIFGSTENSNSLLLSHDDLFNFFKSILGERSIPAAIKKFFKEDAGGEVIFLGFSFRKWYVQMILRLFNLNKTDNELSRTAYLNTEPPNEEVMFATQNFQVDFIDTHIKEFIETLYQKCKEKGILRQLNDSRKLAGTLLVEERKRRVDEIKKKLIITNKLRSDWEEKEMLSDDPKERLKCETEITKLREDIEKMKDELKFLAS